MQRYLCEFMNYDLAIEKSKQKQKKSGREEIKKQENEEEKQILTASQLDKKSQFEHLLLETLTIICTKYDTMNLKLIERFTWETFLTVFLKYRKKYHFQYNFCKLVDGGFKLDAEPIVLDMILYQNIIGELWDIIQERQRDLILFKEKPHNEHFFYLCIHLIKLLENIEGNTKTYPIMNKQFSFNLAWVKIREYRGRDPPGPINLFACKKNTKTGPLTVVNKKVITQSSMTLPVLAKIEVVEHCSATTNPAGENGAHTSKGNQ